MTDTKIQSALIQDASMAAPSAKQMTVAEARQVMWLRTNPRPIGELLDDGFLNRRSLEWAAEKAYDLRIRQAAHVLLSISEPIPSTANLAVSAPATESVPAAMTISQARATLWPFRELKGQTMG